MHRKHLLPGFDDRSSDETAIERLTSDITDVSDNEMECSNVVTCRLTTVTYAANWYIGIL